MNRAYLLSLLSLLCLPALASAKSTPVLYVQVKDGELRATPTHLGKLTGKAEYGTPLQIESNKGAWVKVSSEDGKLAGWMHSSLLTKKKISMEAGSSTAKLAASDSEMALATKGFNSDVEKAFKAKNPNVSFTWVDKMESIKVQDSEIAAFLKEGNVQPKEAE